MIEISLILKLRNVSLLAILMIILVYRFLNDQDRKILRYRNVTFNENLMYKDKLEVEPTNTSKQSSKTVELEEISENEVARGITIDSEIENEELEAESGSEPKSKPEIESTRDVEPTL